MSTKPRNTALSALLAALALAVVPACKSDAEQRENADREAYELVSSRRAKLGIEEASFTIEPDPESLRQRLLRGEAPETKPFALAHCLEIAAENSRDYQTHKESLYLAALDVTLERWRFALQSGGTLSGSVAGIGDEADLAAAGGELSFSKLFANGGQLLAHMGLALTHSLVSSDGWNPISDVGLTFTQPLLAGASRLVVEESLTQTERNLIYEVRSFERFRHTFALDVTSRYQRILQSVDAVHNQENNVKNLTALRERNAALVESGRLADLELGQARQNELSSKTTLLETQALLDKQLDDFKSFMGLPPAMPLELDPHELETLKAENRDPLPFGEESAVGVALAERLDHMTTLDREVDAERHVRVAEDALRASLSVNGSVDLVNTPDRALKFNGGHTIWSAGFDYSAPWEKLPARNVWREAQIRHEAAQRASAQSADDIRSALRDDLRQVETQRQSYEIQLNAVGLADKRIESTRLKLDAGRADTRDLLEAQAALLEAQNAATAALIDYTLARLRLFLDMELLRVGPSGIEIGELPAAPKENGS